MAYVRLGGVAAPAVIACSVTACVSLAPGADKVRLTKTPSDVARCSAVGNVSE